MALAEKRICEHTDATTISSADEFIVDSMANGTRNITMTNLENQILSTDTYSALSGIGDGTITGSIADIDSNLNNLTYDSSTNRLTMTGNTAFSGTIDSVPTAGSGNAVSSGGTKTYVDSAVSQLNDEIGVISSGIQDITRKVLTANNEDAFLLLAYADILADMGPWVGESPKCVTRVYTAVGIEHYIINAYRVQPRWIYSFCFTEGKAYYISYDCDNNSIKMKKSFTLT